MTKQKEPSLNKKSERVVVDEIFDDGIARLLRSPRLPNIADKVSFAIQNWDEEREDFIESWRVEAFVGYPSKQRLREGDVFFIADGSKLTANYKPIPREKARQEHLLLDWDISSGIARNEIKKQFSKLAATKMSTGTKDREKLIDKVDKKFDMASLKGK
ncbi:MAG: hypothetical protein JRH09_15500 [Deltaproteobacteria bacterium]|nr:hypothetical protein [Deltaproteobacteria bacterium]